MFTLADPGRRGARDAQPSLSAQFLFCFHAEFGEKLAKN